MAKAIFHRRFNATDPKKGISIRVDASAEPQTLPEWVIAKAEEAGAATRQIPKPKAPAATGTSKDS
ncbi:hypothetical protein [Paracoccus sp. (in: a-proteobacteria)]|uniref:hypothetical protein n=1 Tax=Paracoccus sp. TaxID=267 RepID=UPI00289F77F1|nr:hypothetical protein [Paracoccus sp. (in: a-proteobacteria)]